MKESDTNKKLACELITWDRFYALCQQLSSLIIANHYRPDVIVAIARGGYAPARILADYLGVMDLVSIRIEHYRGTHKEPQAVIKNSLLTNLDQQQILIVDDVSDTGDTFRAAMQHVEQHSIPKKIKTAAIHHKVVSNYVPDFYANKVTEWRWIIYPWAVIEDLTSLIKSMEPRPESLEGIARRLEQDYGLRLPTPTIQEVITRMEQKIW